MNHPITVGAIICVLLGLGGLIVAGCGFLEYMGGAMSDAPAEGDAAGKHGCVLFLIGLALIVAAAFLGGCATTATVQTKTIEVDKPVAIQPIKAADVPVPPAPLGPRPPTLRQSADALLAQVCRFVAYVDKAVPLLSVSAGLPPEQAPDYPECRPH